jgi:hypothetical protein
MEGPCHQRFDAAKLDVSARFANSIDASKTIDTVDQAKVEVFPELRARRVAAHYPLV